MKIHYLAKSLKEFADILYQLPDKEISELSNYFKLPNELDTRQVALNLKTLHALSKIKKQEWIKVINDYNFDIVIEARDSARNIIGKILNYLDANPSAIDTLKRKAKETKGKQSALSQALDILLTDL